MQEKKENLEDTELEFSVIIVDNKRIHEINKEYRGIDRPTDVISFAYNLTFSSIERTLTDEEIMEIFNNIINKVETKLNVKLRSEKKYLNKSTFFVIIYVIKIGVYL